MFIVCRQVGRQVDGEVKLLNFETHIYVFYVCMYVCMYVCLLCMYVCMYVCYVCMYVGLPRQGLFAGATSTDAVETVGEIAEEEGGGVQAQVREG